MYFIPLKSGELKVREQQQCSPLCSVTFGSSGGIQVDSLATKSTAIYDHKIWKIVYGAWRDGIGWSQG